MRAGLTLALRRLLNRARSAILVQNLDDHAVIERLGVDSARIALIPGSGVDIDTMTPKPEPPGPVIVAFVGRLVESKGVRTLLAAHERLGQRGRPIQLLLAGTPDPANPMSIPAQRNRSMEQAPQCHASRLRGRHRCAVGLGAYRGLAVPSRGTALEPVGGCGVRTASGGNRRTGMP